MRVATTDIDAAYFALLRAQEERAALSRYQEYLDAERLRLQRMVADADALEAHVDARLRRALRPSDRDVADVLKARHELIDQELRRLPARTEAATQAERDAEGEYRRLKDAKLA